MRQLGCLVLFVLTAVGVLARQQPPAVQVNPAAQGGQAATQPPVTGTAAVMGQVVDARGAGVPSAIVMLQGGYRPIALTTDNREIPGGPRYTITTRDGHFAFFDLTAGTYAFDANKPGYIAGAYGRLRPGGQPQSINLKDGDRYTAIRISIWEYASVTGTIRDETAPEYFIIIFPADKALWAWQSRRIQQTRPSHDGKFSFKNLPAGEYLLGAVTDVEQYQWFEPAFLTELLGASVKLTLADGEKKVQSISIR